MSRELNRLIRRLKGLSPDEIARVQQFMNRMRALDLSGGQAGRTSEAPGTDDLADDLTDGCGGSGEPDSPVARMDTTDRVSAACEPDPPQAACRIDDDPCAVWRRRPFQAVDDDDLQPIAALFREAIDSRAAARHRFGSR